MSTPRFVLVTGATGQQGGAVARALLAKGHRVRAFTRNTDSASARELASLGAEPVAGDFTDSDSLRAAMAGVDSVYAMSTPFESGMQAEVEQGLAVTNAVKASGVGHLVYSSVASADKATGVPHFDSKWEVEKAIAQSGVPYTVSAPVYFAENLVATWNLPGLREGKVAAPLPGGRTLQQVGLADIGRFANSLIERRDEVFGSRFDIASAELTGDEMAGVLSEVIGREIRYESFPVSVMRDQSEDMALMYEWFDATGYDVDIPALHEGFPEVGWHDFKTWAATQDWTSLLAGDNG